jgi:hypothetical protein
MERTRPTPTEESDDSASPGLRRLFDDLEAAFEAGLRREAEQEALAAVRAELGTTVLWEQLARRVGAQTTVLAGARVLRGDDGTEHLVRYGPAVSIALPAEPLGLQPTSTPSARRYQFTLALRELARRREPVRIELADAGGVDGTIEAVGSDYLEVAEHDPGEARRRAAVRSRRFIGFAAVVAVTLPRPGR